MTHLASASLPLSVRPLPSGSAAPRALARLLGDSVAMNQLRTWIARVAHSDAPILIHGESGTGKELIARALHEESAVRGPFLAFNCGSVPDTLLDSIFFGHERGAFTGAHQRQLGLFEQASGGTLLLDEVGELSALGQAKLLRVLESWEVLRLGATRSCPVKLRVVCATHRDLSQRVQEGAFREDLFFRIHVLTVHAPALRTHVEDLPVLCAAFLGQRERLSEGALAKLQAYDFPGNVRELRALLQRAALLREADAAIDASCIVGLRAPMLRDDLPSLCTLAEAEAAHVRYVLESVHWNKAQAARILGVERPTLYAKLKRHGLTRGAP